MIRVGILGCANIALRSLLPAFSMHPCFQVVAVASRSLIKATEIAKIYQCKACLYDELVHSPNIDLIYIPLPTGLHYEWVIKSLNASKHVLCEKSIASNLIESKEMVALAQQKRCLLFESFQWRFHAQTLKLKRLLQEGVIGEIRCFRASFGFPPFSNPTNIRYKKELAGGALLDAGAYTIKAVTEFLGSNISLKVATAQYSKKYSVDIAGALFFERFDGVTAQTAYGFDHFYQCGIDVWGSKGRLRTNRLFTAPSTYVPFVEIETIESIQRLDLPQDDHFVSLLDAVSSCINNMNYEEEYRHILLQSELLNQAKDLIDGN